MTARSSHFDRNPTRGEEMTTGDVLAASLAELREHGWTKGVLINDAGQMCARGAIYKAVTGDVYGMGSHKGFLQVCEAESVLEKYIPQDFIRKPSYGYSTLVNYNNTRTSFTEIEEWFEKAIANEGVSNG